ncbi:MAG: hypothetical protein WBW53_03480 [Terriglobales bacterium]
MPKRKKKNALIESIPMLLLLGILAGALGGVGVGLMTSRSSSSSSSATK